MCVQAMSELSEQQEEVRQLARSSLDTLQEVSLSLSLSPVVVAVVPGRPRGGQRRGTERWWPVRRE